MVHRLIKPRTKAPKKPYYDEEDRAALRKMNKLRVDWSASEDSLLLLCKVASCYLLPSSPRPRMLPFTLVRNILHKRFPESQNKTGRACQRRINYIMKDPTTADSVAIFVEEVRQDPYIKQHFVPPRIPQNRENLESVYGTIFVDLVEHLVTKFSSNSNRNYLKIPNSLDEFLSKYKVIPAKSIKPVLTYPDPKFTEDIQFHVIQTLLYSSLCCRADRESYAYQLYQAYSQFSQQLLYNALVSLRTSQMISYKKCYNRSSNSQTCLPLSASPFQLSMSYIHKFVTKYQYDVFDQCWSFLKRLKESYTNAYLAGKRPEDLVRNSELAVPMMRNKNNEGGCVAALIEQTSLKRVIMHTFLPETIIIVDTNRTITSKLPYQKSTIPRRVNDLAEASGKKIDMSAVSRFTSLDDGGQLSNNKKRRRAEDDLEESRDEPSTKRKPLISTVEVSEFGRSAAESNATEEETNSPLATAILSSDTFDDSFDMNDESLDATNTTTDCMERAHSEERSSSSSAATSFVNKRVKELQFGALGHKRRLSSSSLSITISAAKKHRGEEALARCGGGEVEGSFDPSGGERNEFTTGDVLTSAPDTDNDTETELGEQSILPADDVKKVGSRGRHVTSASRLSVFMKDQSTMSLLENQDIGSGGPALLQHMQDNLLLAACDVTCQLTVPSEAGLSVPTEGDSSGAAENCSDAQRLQRCLLPVDKEQQTTELMRFTRGEVDTSVTLEDVVSQWQQSGCSEQMVSLMRDIYAFVDGCGIAGANRTDIKRWRASVDGAGPCMAVVEEMESAGLLVREGVAHHTWLTVQHAHHWLVHTQHLSRLERQSLRLQGVYCMKVETQSESKNTPETSDATGPDGAVTAAPSEGSEEPAVVGDTALASDCPAAATAEDSLAPAVGNEIQAENEAAPSAEEDDVSDGLEGDRADGGGEETEEGEADAGGAGPADTEERPECGLVRSRLAMTTRRYTKDKKDSAKMEQLVHDYQRKDRREQVAVSLRPWIRICGTLNRRVLDRMLGTTLFLVLEQPGISGARVAEHLAPALLPVHVHELLHLLQRLFCVHRTCVTLLDRPTTLFAATSERLVRDEATAEEDEEDVCYVPTVDCITRLSVFIGDTKYSHDFLSDDRR